MSARVVIWSFRCCYASLRGPEWRQLTRTATMAGIEDVAQRAKLLIGASRANSTWTSYSRYINEFTTWAADLDIPLDAQCFTLFLADRSSKWSAGTMAAVASAVNMWTAGDLRAEKGWSDLFGKVIEGTKRLKPRKRQEAFPLEEVSNLMRWLGDSRSPWSSARRTRLARFVCLGFGAFLRASEAVVLRWEDITVAKNKINIIIRKSKTDQYGEGDSAVAALGPLFRSVCDWDAQGPKNHWIFLANDGNQWSAGAASSELKKACKLSGCSIRPPHQLRRGAATSALQAGVDSQLIRTSGRWKSTASMVPYLLPTEKDKLAASSAI